MPPLRERRADLPIFLDHFIERFASELGRPGTVLDLDARKLLLAYDYRGNVRELANIVERAVTLCDGEVIGPRLLPPVVLGASPLATMSDSGSLPPDGMDLQAHLDAVECRILEQALQRTSGVKTEAARLLRVTFRSLRYRLAKFGIGGE
jgi:two-component system response regulator PilR (NtrC family)